MKERLIEWAMTLFAVLLLMSISGYAAARMTFHGWWVYLIGAALSCVVILFPGATKEEEKKDGK